MRLRHAIAAGLVDAGLSSFSTLGIGIYAASVLPPAELGAYALFFSAFALAAAVPTQLVLAPAEFAAVATVPVEAVRLSLVRHTWRLGVPCATMAAVVVSAAAGLGAKAPAADLWALALTTTICSIVSPLQDHVRRVLHLAGTSWCSVLVSLIQLAGAIGVLGVFAATGVRPVWRPLGALAAANTMSLTVGLALAYRGWQGPALPRPRLGRLLRTGRLLLAQELTTIGAFFLSSVVVTTLASPEDLGYAEAARVVSQPLFVLTAGLNLVLGPRSVEAGAGRRRETANRMSFVFATLLLAGGSLLAAVTAMPWLGNPLSTLLPRAYTVTGLVLLTIFAYALIGLAFAPRNELIGAERGGTLIRIGMLAGVLQCLVTAGTSWTGAYARPLGVAVFGAVASVGLRARRRVIYENSADRAGESEEGEGGRTDSVPELATP